MTGASPSTLKFALVLDGFDPSCNNGDKVRAASRSIAATGGYATTEGIKGRRCATSWSLRLNTGSARSIHCPRSSNG